MGMRIDDAGNDRSATQVDYTGVWPAQLLYIRGSADRFDPATVDRDTAGPRRCGVRRIDVSVDEQRARGVRSAGHPERDDREECDKAGRAVSNMGCCQFTYPSLG